MRFVAIPAKALQQLVTLLLFRLGGEQTFTPEEVKEIKETCEGIVIHVDSDNKVILRVRSANAVPKVPPAQEDPQEEVDPDVYDDRDEMY